MRRPRRPWTYPGLLRSVLTLAGIGSALALPLLAAAWARSYRLLDIAVAGHVRADARRYERLQVSVWVAYGGVMFHADRFLHDSGDPKLLAILQRPEPAGTPPGWYWRFRSTPTEPTIRSHMKGLNGRPDGPISFRLERRQEYFDRHRLAQSAPGPQVVDTETRHTLTLPLWSLSLCCLPAPAARLALAVRQRRLRRRRHNAGQCTHCGYDLRATPDRCPECGAQANRTESMPAPGPNRYQTL